MRSFAFFLFSGGFHYLISFFLGEVTLILILFMEGMQECSFSRPLLPILSLFLPLFGHKNPPPLGKLSYKKNGKKRGHCPLWAIPPPKRVKRGHLLSDYRQKCVNATRDILMSKGRKMTILTITMFNENVHTGCLFLTGTP